MKKKLKKKVKPISVYLTDDEYNELLILTEEANLSLTDYMVQAMKLKINDDKRNED